MPVHAVSDIRNIVFVGHAGSGKTSLIEAILHKAGATNRLGSVPDKTSMLDYAEDEKEAAHSIDSALCYVHHNGKHLNLIDTPGGGGLLRSVGGGIGGGGDRGPGALGP
jgi:elongation factor G